MACHFMPRSASACLKDSSTQPSWFFPSSTTPGAKGELASI